MKIMIKESEKSKDVKILLVDDDPQLRLASKVVLERTGYDVVQASTGAEALARLSETQPDLILLDVMLPDTNGIDLCKHIRSNHNAHNVYIIMLSGHKKESEARTAGLEAGADDYLVRPVANRELLARIRAGLRIHQTEEDLRRERDLLDRMMETSPVGITLVDREGQLTFANARAEEILGLSRDALTQRTYNAPEWRITDYEGGPFPQEELPFNQVMAQGEPVYDVRHAIEHPDGHRSLLSINSAPLRDASGQITGMVSTIEDVTERVQEERRRHERLKEELRALAGLASSDQTAITASMFGATPLQETSPHLFDDLCQTYSDLLDRALTARLYKVSVEISDALRMIARRLGARQANPRDVIDLHSAALQAKIENANPRKAKVYVEEGHLVVLELMGYLVSYYQNYVVKEVSKHRDAVTQISETEGDNYE